MSLKCAKRVTRFVTSIDFFVTCLKMSKIHQKWSKMVKNDQKWSKMTKNGQKWVIFYVSPSTHERLFNDFFCVFFSVIFPQNDQHIVPLEMCVFRVFQGAQQRTFCDIFLEYFSTSEKFISGADFLFLRHLKPSQKCVESCHIFTTGRKVEHFVIFCVFSEDIFQARVWVLFFNIHKNTKTHFKKRKSRVAKCPKTCQKMVCFDKKHFCGRHWKRTLQISTQKMTILRVSLFLTFFLIFVDFSTFFQKNQHFLMCKNV